MNNMDFALIPLGKAPPGEDYNLVDGPSQAWMPRLAIYITLPIMISFMVLRLSTHFSLRTRLAWDDC